MQVEYDGVIETMVETRLRAVSQWFKLTEDSSGKKLLVLGRASKHRSAPVCTAHRLRAESGPGA